MSFLKNIWKNNSKHRKLPDEQNLKKSKGNETKERDNEPQTANPKPNKESENNKDAMLFKLKYLGSTAVEKVAGENISPEAVKNVIKVAKASRKKVSRVNVAISLKGIVVTDTKGNQLFEVSIYRISNCATDKQYRQVFSFISIDSNEVMECHVFWCSKRKMAEMVALTVAHAFSTAYEAWRLSPTMESFGKNAQVQSEIMKNTVNNMKSSLIEEKCEEVAEEKLIDFDDDSALEIGCNLYANQTQWVCFEDDFGSTYNNKLDNNKKSFDCAFENDFSTSNGLSMDNFPKQSLFKSQENVNTTWNSFNANAFNPNINLANTQHMFNSQNSCENMYLNTYINRNDLFSNYQISTPIAMMQ